MMWFSIGALPKRQENKAGKMTEQAFLGELAKLFQVLNRDTEDTEQASIRNKMYSDLYFRVFYSSDTDNKFSARQGLNTLLSLAGINMDE